jgi:hypothetical protein
VLEVDTRVKRLEDELLGVLLRLREREIRHELNGHQRICDGPGLGPVAHQAKLPGRAAVLQNAVDAGAVTLAEAESFGTEFRHGGRSAGGKAHLAREAVEDEAGIVASQALADATLADEPDQRHLQQAVLGVGEAQSRGQPRVVLRPHLHHALGRAAHRDGCAPDLERTGGARNPHRRAAAVSRIIGG